MRKLKIYIETSLFNHYVDEERYSHDATVKLFKEVAAGRFEAYTSDYVIEELIKTEEIKRSKMLGLLDLYPIGIIESSDEVEKLADIYVLERLVPLRYRFDAIHIACATVNDIDYKYEF